MKVTYPGYCDLLCEIDAFGVIFGPFGTANPLTKGAEAAGQKVDFISLPHHQAVQTPDVERITTSDQMPLSASGAVGVYGRRGGEKKGVSMVGVERRTASVEQIFAV